MKTKQSAAAMRDGLHLTREKLIFPGCCIIGVTFVGMICNTAGLYFADISSATGASMTAVNIMMSCLNAGGLFGLAAAGILMKRIPLKILMSTAALISGAGLAASSLFHTMPPFYLVWFLIGFSTPFLVTVSLPSILGSWFSDGMGARLGIVYGAAGIGGAVMSTVIGYLIAAVGWRMAVLTEGILALALMLPFTLFVMSTQGDASESKDSGEVQQTGMLLAEAVRTPAFYLLMTAAILLTVVSSLLQQISPHVLSRGFDITVSASVLSAVMIGCAAGNVLMGRLLGGRRLLFTLAVFSLLGVGGWIGMDLADSGRLLMAAGIAAGMGQAIFQTGIPFLTRHRFGQTDYASIIAAASMPASVTGIFSASLGGIIYDVSGSYHLLMLLLAGMFLLALPCLVGVGRSTHVAMRRQHISI